jgi:BCD family chlorophyll transporter-like MFS transporter
MGLWGVAQAFGTGVASVGSGILHTSLIDNGLLIPSLAYTAIFAFEAVGMVGAAAILLTLSVQQFYTDHHARLTQHHLTRALEESAVA